MNGHEFEARVGEWFAPIVEAGHAAAKQIEADPWAAVSLAIQYWPLTLAFLLFCVPLDVYALPWTIAKGSVQLVREIREWAIELWQAQRRR